MAGAFLFYQCSVCQTKAEEESKVEGPTGEALTESFKGQITPLLVPLAKGQMMQQNMVVYIELLK